MPIYLVAAEYVMDHILGLAYFKILDVIECKMEEFRDITTREREKYVQKTVNVQFLIFYREPPNPFRKG